MLVVETIARIRRDHLVKGVPIKKIARDLRVSKNTVRKVVRGDETSFSYARKIQPMPKLGPWVEELERRLEANAKKERKDRLSLLRIHEDLASLGYEGGYDAVRRYARAWRRRRRLLSPSQAFVPLSFESGRGLPVRLEPRIRGSVGRHDPGEGGAHAALPQPDAAGPDLPAREPGDGVRGARARLPLLRRGLPSGHLRQP